MNFSINLATKVYVDFKKVNLCFVLAGVILSIWLFVSVYTCVANAAKIQKLSDYKEKLTKSVGTKKVSDAEYTAFLADVKSVNSILYKRSYDWLALLANLEQLVPEGVALNKLEPDERGANLKLSASARNFSGVRKFIENLESSQAFSEIYLIEQSFIKVEGQKGLNFSVTCKVSAS